MLSLVTSRSKKPSAQPPDPNIRLRFGETAAKAVFLFRLRHFREFASGPRKRLAAFRITAEVADALSKRRKWTRCRSRASNFAVMQQYILKSRTSLLADGSTADRLHQRLEGDHPLVVDFGNNSRLSGGQFPRNLFSELGVDTYIGEVSRTADQGAAGSSDRGRKRTNRQTRQRADESADGCAADSFFGNLLDRQLSVRVPCNRGGGIELDVSFRAQLSASIGSWIIAASGNMTTTNLLIRDLRNFNRSSFKVWTTRA